MKLTFRKRPIEDVIGHDKKEIYLPQINIAGTTPIEILTNDILRFIFQGFKTKIIYLCLSVVCRRWRQSAYHVLKYSDQRLDKRIVEIKKANSYVRRSTRYAERKVQDRLTSFRLYIFRFIYRKPAWKKYQIEQIILDFNRLFAENEDKIDLDDIIKASNVITHDIDYQCVYNHVFNCQWYALDPFKGECHCSISYFIFCFCVKIKDDYFYHEIKYRDSKWIKINTDLKVTDFNRKTKIHKGRNKENRIVITHLLEYIVYRVINHRIQYRATLASCLE